MGNKGSTVTLCKPLTPLTTFMLICSFCGMASLLPLLVYGLYQSRTITSKSLKIMLWITFMMELIAGIVFPVHQILGFEFSGHCADFNRIPITVTIAIISYMASLLCISIIYYIRLILSFKDTNQALSKSVSCLLLFGYVIQFTLLCLTASYNLIAWYNPKQRDIRSHIASWSWLLFSISNLLLNLILLILFMSKMNTIRKTMGYNSTMNAINIVIRPVTVYILCLSLAFISTAVSYIFGFIRSNLVIDTNELFLTSWTMMG
eukprot:114675_1